MMGAQGISGCVDAVGHWHSLACKCWGVMSAQGVRG